MELGLSGDGIDGTEDVSYLHFVSGTYAYIAQLTVEGIIVSVLYKHALIVSRHYRYILYSTGKDRFDRFSGCGSYVAAVVEGQLDVGVDGVIVLTELTYYSALNRPWEFTLIAGELV